MLTKLYKKVSSLNLNGRQFFSLIAAYFIILGFLSVILAMAGIFYGLIIEVYLILGGLALILLFFKNFKTIRFEKSFYLVLAFSVLAIALFSYYSTPTIFSGRDQGSLSEAAIRLSNNHELKFSFPASKEFFNINVKGKALNFPGFNYTSGGDLITQFPLGYISWLAAFFSIFGLKGLIIANGLSFFIFIISFYFLAREFMDKNPALSVFFLVISSFVFSWFFKFTLSENLTIMLLWFGILHFYLYIKNKGRIDLALSLLSLSLLLFVRIEGIAFLFMAFLILFLYGKKENKPLKDILGVKISILFSMVALLYLASIFLDRAFYLGFAKNIFQSFSQSGGADSSESVLVESFFSFKVLSAYAILNYLILGFLGIIYFLKSKKIKKLAPLFIVLPSFIYLIDPNISNDHPWMLRRFIFAIIPVLLLYGVLFSDKFLKNRLLFWLFSGILIATNLFVTVPYVTFRPDDNLLPQIEKISSNFKDSDLVLIDREATGDAHSMMSGPMNFLFNKQSVYFFNPKDLEKINRNNFSDIYLIVPDKNLELYQSSGLLAKMVAQKEYAIELKSLNIIINPNINLKKPVVLPEKETLITYGKIYLLMK